MLSSGEVSKSLFVPPNLPSFADLCRTADENLFDQVIASKEHVLHGLLQPHSGASQNYNLRNRNHNLELPTKICQLTNCNFIHQMLFSNIYWLLTFTDFQLDFNPVCLIILSAFAAFWQLLIKLSWAELSVSGYVGHATMLTTACCLVVGFPNPTTKHG